MTCRILTSIFLLLISNIFGQTIQELEHEISFYKSSEKYGDKIDKAKKLQKIDPFNYKATEYICRYYSDRKIDSISIYFDNLINKFPTKTEPYLLRYKLAFLEVDYRNKNAYKKHQEKYLKKALLIDSKDPIIIFNLAELYYKDFIFPLEKEKDYGLVWIESESESTEKIIKKSTFKHPANNSLKYLYELWKLNLNENTNEIIFYPIRQLECYLELKNESLIPKNYKDSLNQCYFPYSYFTSLKNDWECDFTINYISEITSGRGNSKSLETHLIDLNEECLYNIELKPNSKIYRFTWLRSFHNPIVIRIEKIENTIILYWKIGKGMGGYELEGLKESGKKKINFEKWRSFERLINLSNFENLPNEEYIPMTDGATWTVEKRDFESFKAHHTNSPNKEIIKACMYLLDLTNIKIKDEEKY